MSQFRSLCSLLVITIIGCGESQRMSRNYAVTRTATKASRPSMSPSPPAAGEVFAKRSSPMAIKVTDGASTALIALQPPLSGAAQPATPAIARKIIYDAQVDLIVDSVDPVAAKIASLVQEAQGYIAEQTLAGSPGSVRSMHWKFRIPVDHFDSFAERIIALGELERNNRTSQDVTEQYYDLEARIKNKQLEEQTLSKILQERSGKLEDVLKIEIELSRVRGEIEQFQGKIRVLENLSSLATLNLNIRERDKYAPPAPVVADFPTQVSRVWHESLLGLADTGKALVLWAVSWAVYIPFLLIAALFAWILIRSLIRTLMRNLPRIIAIARTPLTRPRPSSSE